MEPLKTRTRRLVHFTSFLSVFFGLFFGVGCYWLTRTLWTEGGFLIRMQGILTAGFFVELGIVFKLYAAIEECLPRPGRRGGFRPTTRENVWRQAGFIFLCLAIILFAFAVIRVLTSQELELLRNVYLGRPLELEESPSRLIMLFTTLTNALMLLAIHCLSSALAVRFHAETETAAGLMTIITGAPKFDESRPPAMPEDIDMDMEGGGPPTGR